MKKIFYTALYFCSALLMSSCIGDLDQYPHEEETSSTIYTSAANYKAVLGKIYAAMVTTGQERNGDNDLSSTADRIICAVSSTCRNVERMKWLLPGCPVTT